jgi:hypothetical protein
VLVLGLTYRSDHVVDAGFWFEPVTYDLSEAMIDRLGGAITDVEMRAIASIASSEVSSAFSGLRIRVSDRRDATYQVRVVQDLQNLMFPRGLRPAGQSRAIPGVGGRGTVNFRMLTRSAIAYAPTHAGRPEIIAAIGRGIGRAAVHEFAHQLLGGIAPIHETTDVESYEYASADRREQYYGPMHWDIAWDMLRGRWGSQRPGRSGGS